MLNDVIIFKCFAVNDNDVQCLILSVRLYRRNSNSCSKMKNSFFSNVFKGVKIGLLKTGKGIIVIIIMTKEE